MPNFFSVFYVVLFDLTNKNEIQLILGKKLKYKWRTLSVSTASIMVLQEKGAYNAKS